MSSLGACCSVQAGSWMDERSRVCLHGVASLWRGERPPGQTPHEDRMVHRAFKPGLKHSCVIGMIDRLLLNIIFSQCSLHIIVFFQKSKHAECLTAWLTV